MPFEEFVVRELGPYVPNTAKPAKAYEHPAVARIKKMEAERAREFPQDTGPAGQIVGYGGWGGVSVR